MCAIACLITYVAYPLGLVTTAIYYSLSKRTLPFSLIPGGTMLNPVDLIVHFNSLLGMLNARESFRGNEDGGIVEILSEDLPSQSSGSRHEYPPMPPYTFGKKPRSYEVGL
jgi:hypothetical protein